MRDPYPYSTSLNLGDIMVCAACDTIITTTDVCQTCGDYDYSMRLYVYLNVVRPEVRMIIEQNASV